MAENAYSFIQVASIFPFLLVFAFALVLACLGFGLALFISGLKSKSSELKNAGRVVKIIKIVVGALLLAVGIFAGIYLTLGLIELGERGGAFANASNNNAAEILINYLLLLL